MKTFSQTNETGHESKEEIEIDIGELLLALLSKAWLILISALLIALLTFIVNKWVLTPVYDSATRIYIMSKTQELSVLTASDIQVNTDLTADYQELIRSRTVLEKVIKQENLSLSYQALYSKISVNVPSETRIIEISVSDEEPKVAQSLANAVREVATEQILSVMDIQAVNVVDEAYLPTQPSTPEVRRNTMLAALAGALLSIAFIIIWRIKDDRIYSEDDVEKYLGVSVLGAIPVEEGSRISKKRGKKAKVAYVQSLETLQEQNDSPTLPDTAEQERR
ncbi:MAG: Wzz/FepE/Etk N-terminal domain-containing protein [Lachnospiraceae bacterium]